MKFTTRHVDFKTRVLKTLSKLALMISVFFVLSLIKNQSTWVVSLSILAVGFGTYLIYYFVSHEGTVVTEVEFLEQRMIITGYRVNTRWQKEFDIAASSIQIKSQGKGRGNVEYYLRVSSQNQAIKINFDFNWDYPSLLGIFREFKSIKGEKIIFDEKYFLDIMEKKAQGLSTLDIAFGKEVKK
ncbi:MAG: hypothetical protein ACK5RG_21765 [Cyclobacteriaceae bacterium]|jgi:hypothetical protein